MMDFKEFLLLEEKRYGKDKLTKKQKLAQADADRKRIEALAKGVGEKTPKDKKALDDFAKDIDPKYVPPPEEEKPEARAGSTLKHPIRYYLRRGLARVATGVQLGRRRGREDAHVRLQKRKQTTEAVTMSTAETGARTIAGREQRRKELQKMTKRSPQLSLGSQSGGNRMDIKV